MPTKNFCSHGMRQEVCRICASNQVAIKNAADDLLFSHETFMINLCGRLQLDYTHTTEDDVLKAIDDILDLIESDCSL
jgi:hypothetical protein